MKVLFILILTVNVIAQDTLLIFCSQSNSSLELKSGIANFATKSDKVMTSGADCIEVFTTKQREDLITKIMRLKFSDITIKTTNAIESKVCSIQIEKISNSNSKNQFFNINQKSNIQDSNSMNTSSEISYIIINEGNSGSINYNGNNIELKCRYINSELYEVTVSIQSNNSDQTKNQNISSTINLGKGSKVEIGGIVKNLNNQNNKIGIPSGINKNKIQQIEQTKIFLSIKQI